MSSKPVILYVEDDIESREILRLLVTNIMGIENLTIFEDSENFIERLHALEPQPNLILLDIHVPPYNGFEMLKMLHELEEFADVPIVALTASVMNEEVQQLQQAGFDSIIPKPLDMDKFPILIRQILQGSRVWNVIY